MFSRSVLSELKYFDVSSGALILDVMHDILKGALQYEAKYILKQFVNCDHYFTLTQLNQQIQALELGTATHIHTQATHIHTHTHTLTCNLH